jgi:dimethylargininase
VISDNPVALVRRPGPRLADGLVTHIERRPADTDLAARQWENYVATLRDHGWQTVEVAAADDSPDSVFVEDTVVVVGGRVAVLTRPGAPSRRAEVAAVEATVRELGLELHRIEPPGTLDGGDVLKIGDTAFVGRGGRTNNEGIRQLTEIVAAYGMRVVPVDVSRVLHLKSAVTALPDGTVIGHPSLVDDASVFPHFLAVPEESGSHVVVLDDRRLLMAADAPETADMFRRRGYEPVCVDISEFQKLEGCVTCLSVRIRG